MNIYDYFNSRDIAAHCKSINHNFSGLEMAYIVWHSEYHTMAQKHSAWQEIIDSIPDEKLPKGSWVDDEMLHPFLKRYIKMEQDFLKNFPTSSDGVVFSYELNGSYDQCYIEDDHLYFDYHECLKSAAETVADRIDTVLGVRIVKRKICNSAEEDSERQIIRMNAKLQVMEIDEYVHKEEDSDDWRLEDAFMGFWVMIPTPFKYGDIVTVNNLPGEANEPCVLSWIPYWTKGERGADYTKTVNRFLDGYGDCSDMSTGIYKQDDAGEIYSDHGPNYLFLEYYRDELKSKQRLLLAVSNYLQDRIYLDDLLRSHSVLLLEDYAASMRDCGKIDEIQYLSGLIDKPKDGGSNL